jgi:hypothetical protein
MRKAMQKIPLPRNVVFLSLQDLLSGGLDFSTHVWSMEGSSGITVRCQGLFLQLGIKIIYC